LRKRIAELEGSLADTNRKYSSSLSSLTLERDALREAASRAETAAVSHVSVSVSVHGDAGVSLYSLE
jgi:hypothetical protein